MWLLIRFDQSWGYLPPSPFQKPFGPAVNRTSECFPTLLKSIEYCSEVLLKKSDKEVSFVLKHVLWWDSIQVLPAVLLFLNGLPKRGTEPLTTQDWSLCSSHLPKTETVVSLPLCVCCLSLYLFFSFPFLLFDPHPLLSSPPLLCEQLPHFLSLAPCWCLVGNIRWLLGK